MTDAVFSYKYLIYEPNLTKFLTNVETIAAHKPCEFQKYRLRESPTWGEKVAKISDFWGFSDRKSPDMGQLGSTFLFAKIDPNRFSGSPPAGRTTERSHFNTGSFLPVTITIIIILNDIDINSHV